MTSYIEQIKNITVNTLEKNTGVWIESWIADWNQDGEPVEWENKQVVWIGELDYRPIKYKCPECGRWNYTLTFVDPTGAMEICSHCKADLEL